MKRKKHYCDMDFAIRAELLDIGDVDRLDLTRVLRKLCTGVYAAAV